jgi:hypothetical protein
MDHEVSDHIDIGSAVNERPQAMHLDEASVLHMLGQGHDTGIEALEVTNLQYGTITLRELDNLPRFLIGRCYRFF